MQDLISRLLDPTATSRITTEEILAHKWLAQAEQKTTTSKSRRNGVALNSMESHNLMDKILELNECFCPCHNSVESNQHRDSVISQHCPDCDDVVANDSEILAKRAWMIEKSSSICSSGYGGSEFGSQLTLNERYSVTTHPNELSPIASRRSSSPRREVLTTLTQSEKRFSVPHIAAVAH